MIRYQGRNVRDIFFAFAEPLNNWDLDGTKMDNGFADELFKSLDAHGITYEQKGSTGIFRSKDETVTIGDFAGSHFVVPADALTLRAMIMRARSPELTAA